MAKDTIPSAGRFHAQAECSTTLPSHWYTDPEIFALEKERIFSRSWWYAGALSMLERAGSYLTTRVVDQDVFVIRGNDGGLRAFYNVCSHRAHRLVDGCGERDPIVCPYHGWTYDNDGRFKAARGIEGIRGFDRAAAGLKAIRVDTCVGLVFVNLDPNAGPLAEVAGDMVRDLRDHCPGLDHLTLAHTYEVDSAANWKVLVDNNLESYHVATAHPALVDLLDYRSFAVWEHAHSTAHAMTNTNPDNAAYLVGDNDPVQRAVFTWLWPNTEFFINPGRNNLAVMNMIPLGPQTSRQRWDFYFEDENLDAAEQAYLDYTIDTLIPEDSALYENVQRGLNSRGYQQGRFIINRDQPELSEHHVHPFQKLVHDALRND